MRVIYYLQNNIKAIHVLAITFLTLTSCGTYQQATYDDGIYSSGEQRRETAEVVNNNDSDNAYQNYFEQKSYEADDRYGEVFTDVEEYSSQDNAEPQSETDVDGIGYTESYSPWGETAENITINVYDSGWNNWGWNNWGWNNWRWNRWGWNRWGWGGYNNYWGWGGYNNWGLGWNSWCWGGFNNWGYGPYYGYGRSPYGNYAYNRGRRAAYANRALASRRANYYSRSSNRTSRYSNTRSTRRGNNARTTRNTRNTRATRNTRNTRNTRATRNTRNTRNTRATRNTRNTRNTRATRSTRSTRSAPVRSNFNNRSRVNSSSSSSRSSGSSARSSSSSSRSSGSRAGSRRDGRN